MSGGIRLFESGEILTAANVNTYLMDQVVARFADATERNNSFGGLNQPTLETTDEGRICYLVDTNELQYWDGSTWISFTDNAVVGIVDAKGDLIVGTAANTLTRLPAGTNGYALIADSSTGTGLKWDSVVPGNGSITTPQIADGSITSDKIVDGTILNIDVNASAAIAHSKLANASAGQVLIGTTTTGVITATTLSGDVTVSGAGVTAISSGVIVDADINASAAIADTKLATISTAGKVSNSATTATSANTVSAIVARDASGNFAAGKATLATADVTTVIETATISATAATGTINIDFSTNPTVYYTSSATANWTLNVRGTSSASLDSILSTGQIATVTFLATNGATPYRPTVFQVDSSAVTPKWMGGTAPSAGNANSIDVYTLSIIKTGSATFTMLASQSRFA